MSLATNIAEKLKGFKTLAKKSGQQIWSKRWPKKVANKFSQNVGQKKWPTNLVKTLAKKSGQRFEIL